jgi:putative transposase
MAEVVTIDVADMNILQLQQEVLALRKRIRRLVALLRLVMVLLKIAGFSLANARIPDQQEKHKLLRAIERSRSVLPLRIVLNVLRLSHARYHSWKREEECDLEDMPSCPRVSPHQLTTAEIATIKEMVISEEYRHVPTGTLALLAQRLGKVFASASTWYRLVRWYHWRRPRKRVHPSKPKVGIRASRPNEIWHVDTTVVRLLDASRIYLHAVIDNYSRRILAWRVSATFNPNITAEILLSASKHVVDGTPRLLVDGGVENFNKTVDELVDAGLLKRVLARTDITFSNSLIESWWRVLKHQWLFLNTLDTVRAVERLVAFYVQEHNTRLPHSAFHGQTPDEMYFGTGKSVPKQLATARQAARQARMEANRRTSCETCDRPTEVPS